MKKMLKIVPEPKEGNRAVLAANESAHPGFLFIRGVGDFNLTCGNCGATLCKSIEEGQMKHVILQCPHCKLYNET